ncbi:MAG: undecaprenyl-diphosphatase, partial [Gammaproteobacteria bacterium]|nr:undecaprenyl-diphosphatase [Gammaproteobacteria bacterium]
GLTREAASRFSFLLAMPAIALAGAWQLRQLLRADANPQWGELAFAALVSALIAFATIRWFLAFVRRHSLLWFALYRVLLGAVLLAVFL